MNMNLGVIPPQVNNSPQQNNSQITFHQGQQQTTGHECQVPKVNINVNNMPNQHIHLQHQAGQNIDIRQPQVSQLGMP